MAVTVAARAAAARAATSEVRAAMAKVAAVRAAAARAAAARAATAEARAAARAAAARAAAARVARGRGGERRWEQLRHPYPYKGVERSGGRLQRARHGAGDGPPEGSQRFEAKGEVGASENKVDEAQPYPEPSVQGRTAAATAKRGDGR